MPSRRAFLNRLALAVPAAGLSQAASAASAGCAVNERVTLDGLWDFRLDTETKWKTVTVPHTWQTAAESAGFYGVGWYERGLASQSGDVYWSYVDYLHSHGEEVSGPDRDPAKSFAALDRIVRQEAATGKLDT